MHETALGKALVGGLLCCALTACSSDDAEADAPAGQGSGATGGTNSSNPNTEVLPELPGGGGDEDGPYDSCPDNVPAAAQAAEAHGFGAGVAACRGRGGRR